MTAIWGCVACVLVAGCGKTDADSTATPPPIPATASLVVPAPPPDPVDLTRLNKAFETANPALRLYVDEAIAVVRARTYGDAAEQFQKLARNPNLTPEQRQAVQEVLVKVQALGKGGR